MNMMITKNYFYFSETPADVMSCRFSPDGNHLAVGLCDGAIKVGFLPITATYKIKRFSSSHSHIHN